MQIQTIGAGLLVLGGLMNALPPVSLKLSSIFGGKPILQVLIGVGSVILGLVMIAQTS